MLGAALATLAAAAGQTENYDYTTSSLASIHHTCPYFCLFIGCLGAVSAGPLLHILLPSPILIITLLTV